MIDDALSRIQPFEAQARFFKALTHPARLAILELLREGENCVCHLEAYLGLRQAYISQQLAVLRDSGLIQDRRDGWNIYYRVADPRIFEVLDIIRGVSGQAIPDMRRSGLHCSCPRCLAEQESADPKM